LKLSSEEQRAFNQAPFDYLSIGIINFDSKSYEIFDYSKSKREDNVVYDLASLSKPLILNSFFLAHPNLFNDEMKLLLNHRGGVPSWGRLSSLNWREQIEQYDVKESETLYSDFSALKLQFLIERKPASLYNWVKDFYKDKISFWKDLKEDHFCPRTGYRKGKVIQGQINDDNAFIINEFTSHTGLFSSNDNLCDALIQLDQELDLINKTYSDSKHYKHRFVNGWDRVEDIHNTLAGAGCSEGSFGHLGFTGTSIWIDPVKRLGYSFLSNATQEYWFKREELNFLRKSIGKKIWRGDE